MRDGCTRRTSTSSRSHTWTPDRVRVQHWRERHRHAVLRELADRSQGVAWTRRLLNVLLEELHVTDEFDRLVGPTSRLLASQYPRLVTIALLLRHSWSLHDLARTGSRIGLSVGALEPALNTNGCDCRSRRRGKTRAPLTEPSPH
jgi:hypothetical protein